MHCFKPEEVVELQFEEAKSFTVRENENEAERDSFIQSLLDGANSISAEDRAIVLKSWNLITSYAGPSEGKTGVTLFTNEFQDTFKKHLTEDEKLIFEFAFGVVFQVQEVMRLIAVAVCAVTNYDSFKSSILEFCIKPRLYSMDSQGYERFKTVISACASVVAEDIAHYDQYGQHLEQSTLGTIGKPDEIVAAWRNVITEVGKIIFHAQNYAKTYSIYFPVHLVVNDKIIDAGIVLTSDAMNVYHDRKCAKLSQKLTYREIATVSARNDSEYPNYFGVVTTLKNKSEFFAFLDNAPIAKQFEQLNAGRVAAYLRIHTIQEGLASDIQQLKKMNEIVYIHPKITADKRQLSGGITHNVIEGKEEI